MSLVSGSGWHLKMYIMNLVVFETFQIPVCLYVSACSASLSSPELSAAASLGIELPQQPSSAQCSSGVLTHKELHTQLTQRLEQVLRERDQQGEPCTTLPKEKSSMGLHLSVSRGPEVGPESVKQSQRPKPAKPTQSRQTKSSDMVRAWKRQFKSHNRSDFDQLQKKSSLEKGLSH